MLFQQLVEGIKHPDFPLSDSEAVALLVLQARSEGWIQSQWRNYRDLDIVLCRAGYSKERRDNFFTEHKTKYSRKDRELAHLALQLFKIYDSDSDQHQSVRRLPPEGPYH